MNIIHKPMFIENSFQSESLYHLKQFLMIRRNPDPKVLIGYTVFSKQTSSVSVCVRSILVWDPQIVALTVVRTQESLSDCQAIIRKVSDLE